MSQLVGGLFSRVSPTSTHYFPTLRHLHFPTSRLPKNATKKPPKPNTLGSTPASDAVSFSSKSKVTAFGGPSDVGVVTSCRLWDDARLAAKAPLTTSVDEKKRLRSQSTISLLPVETDL